MGRNVSLSLDDKEAKTFDLKDGAGHYNLSFGADNKPVLIKAEEGKDVHKMDNVVEEKRRLEIEDYGLRKTDAKKIDTMDTNLSGTRKEKVDIDIEQFGRGKDIKVGNDILAAMIINDSTSKKRENV